jgi:thiamine-monophosphate kinase
MLDISDGLAKDASRIAAASGVHVVIEPMQLQGFEAILEGAAQALAASPQGKMTATEYEHKWVIGGGEDHGLLATFSPEATLPRGFKKIGRVVALGEGQEPTVYLSDKPIDAGLGWDSVTGS